MKFFLVVSLALVAQGYSSVLNQRNVVSLPVFSDLRPDQAVNIVDTPNLPVFTDLRPDQSVNIVDTPDLPIFTDLRPDQNVNIVDTPDLPFFTDLRPNENVDIVDTPETPDFSHLPGIIDLPNLVPEIQEEQVETTTFGADLESEEEYSGEPEAEVEDEEEAQSEDESEPAVEGKPEVDEAPTKPVDEEPTKPVDEEPTKPVDEAPTKPVDEGRSACDVCFEHIVALINALENSLVSVRKDFFGRVIETATSSPGKNANNALKNDIWFQYKEGYSNAVKKKIKISALK